MVGKSAIDFLMSEVWCLALFWLGWQEVVAGKSAFCIILMSYSYAFAFMGVFLGVLCYLHGDFFLLFRSGVAVEFVSLVRGPVTLSHPVSQPHLFVLSRPGAVMGFMFLARGL